MFFVILKFESTNSAVFNRDETFSLHCEKFIKSYVYQNQGLLKGCHFLLIKGTVLF